MTFPLASRIVLGLVLVAGPLRAQEVEPNDSFATATVVLCGQTIPATMGGPTARRRWATTGK